MFGQIATVEICSAHKISGRYVLGLCCILLQCFVWITASVLTQYMFAETPLESPFLMSYCGVAMMAFMLPFHMLIDRWKNHCGAQHCLGIEPNDSFAEEIANASAYNILDIVATRSRLNATTQKQWDHKKHALAAIFLAPAMFLSDYTYNRGLLYTTVASSTVLVSTSCVFVLFLSVLLQVEPFRWLSLAGVLFTVLGTALTTMHDAKDQDEAGENNYDPILVVKGDMFSLLAAVGYAVYSIQARILCPENEDLFSMPLLLGYVGVIVAVPMLPMAIFQFWQLSGVDWHLIKMLIIKGSLDFMVTDYLLFRAVILTNATIANVGLGLSIPLAFVADAVVKSKQFSALQLSGAAIVLVGFIMVNAIEEKKENDVTLDAEGLRAHSDKVELTEHCGIDKVESTDDVEHAQTTKGIFV